MTRRRAAVTVGAIGLAGFSGAQWFGWYEAESGSRLYVERASPMSDSIAQIVTLDVDAPCGLMGSCGTTGRRRLVIRSPWGFYRFRDDYDLDDEDLSVMLKWVDDHHLEVWSENRKLDLRDTDQIGDVSVALKSFKTSEKLYFPE